ncbi:MAG: helix-turn-helix domain-containing protein [Firmicutes bacterium]|nr:helix-turn-helix domain-containing protein [Bacillota bacterium]
MKLYENIGYKLGLRCRAVMNNVLYHPFHAHKSDFEIICVLDGKLKLSNSAVDYDLQSGDVYFLNPEEPHRLFSDQPNIVLTIHFSMAEFPELFDDSMIPPPYYICDSFLLQETKNAPDLLYLRFLLAKIYTEYTREKPSEIKLRNTFDSLITLLLEQFRAYYYINATGFGYELTRKPIDSLTVNDYTVYDIVHNVIYKEYATKLNLEKLALDYHVSESALSRKIKKSIGITFTEMLTLARCEEAERLLADTNKNLNDVALDVGFSNRKHLTTMFKKWYQKTPGEFRKGIQYDLKNSAQIYVAPFDHEKAKDILEQYLDQYWF